jgi:hypothetical protein
MSKLRRSSSPPSCDSSTHTHLYADLGHGSIRNGGLAGGAKRRLQASKATRTDAMRSGLIPAFQFATAPGTDDAHTSSALSLIFRFARGDRYGAPLREC